MGARVPSRAAAAVSAVGGLGLVLGSFLAWGRIAGAGMGGSASGVDGSDGWITLVAGVVVLGAGVGFAKGLGRRGIAALAVAAGLVGAALGLFDALTAEDRVLDAIAASLAEAFGTSAETAREALDAAVAAEALDFSLGIGLYVVIAGGILGAVGGLLRAGAVRRPAIPPPPVGPSEDPEPRSE